jgi:hypothetical protein
MKHPKFALRRSVLKPLCLLATVGVGLAQQPIDLSNWQAVQYELNFQPDANWALQAGNTSVLQTVNSDACLFIGDFSAVGQEIRGTWRVNTASDDDFMGFVFGYQGRGQYYLFDWKKVDQSFQGDFAERGMSLKIVQMPAGADPTQDDLWPTIGSTNVSVPLHNTIPWVTNVDYEFVLNWVAGAIEITVLQAAQVLEHWVLADTTYTSGEFGFYNYSQDQVLYSGFTQQGVPEIYCTAKTNSQGCTPVLAITGYASATDTASFDITATMLVNRQNGVLFFGRNGRSSIPFGGGLLCAQPSLEGLPIQSTAGNSGQADCSGSLSVDFNAFLQGGGASNLMPGDTVNAQYFYRDPQHSDGSGYGLTEAVEFVVLP